MLKPPPSPLLTVFLKETVGDILVFLPADDLIIILIMNIELFVAVVTDVALLREDDPVFQFLLRYLACV